MANRIRGITVEIGGDTTKLQTALKDVNSTISGTQSKLKDVNKLLKLDPGNTELLSQKHKLLGQAVEETKNKLDTLKTANEQVAASAQNYDAWKAKYDPIKTEIISTSDKLKELKQKAAEAETQLANGQISTEQYDALQSELSDTETKLKELRTAAKAVSDEFGNPISPEQYDALQREIVETEQNLKSLKKQAGESSVAVQQIAATGEKMKTTGEKISDVGEKMLPVTGAVAALGTAAVTTAADFDSAMAQVAAVSGATGEEFDALRDKAREMGSKTKFSASEAADAMNYMAMAGWKTDDMLAGIEGIMNLAAASGEDLATTSDIVTDALTGFGLTAADSAHFSDILAKASSNANTNVSMMGETFKYVAPVAGALGYTAEDTAVAVGLMANAGIKSSQAGTALRSMLTNLAKPSDTVAQYMDALGVSLTDSSGKMLTLNDLMQNLRQKFAGLSEAQQAEAAAGLAGKEAMSGLLAIVNASDSDFDKLTESIANSDGTSQQMADVMQNNLGGQLTILKSQLEELAIAFGDILMPAIRQITSWVQEFVDKLNGMDEGTRKTIITIALIVAAIGPVLIVIGKVVTSVGTILAFVPKIVGVIGAIVSAVGLIPIIIAVVIGAVVFLYNKFEWFRDAVNAVWQAVSDFFQGIWNGIIEFFTQTIPNAWNSVVSFFQGIPEWWSNLWQSVGDFFTDIWNGIVGFFTETIPNAWESVVGFFQGIPDWWAGIWQSVGDFFGNIWGGIAENPIISSITTTIQNLWDNCVNTITGIWEGLTTAAGGIWEMLKNVVLGPVLLLIDLVTGNFTQLKSDAQNIWNNMKNAASEIWEGIGQIFTSAVDGIVTFGLTIFTSLRDGVFAIGETLLTFFTETIPNAWNTVCEKATEMKDFVVNAFWNLVDGAREKLSHLGETIQNGFQSGIEFITSLPGRAYEWGSNFIEGLKSSVHEKLSSIKETIANGFQSAIDWITGLPGRALEWGRDFIDGLIGGITEKISGIGDAVNGVADKIRSVLHFSVPDEGPLTDYESWMPDFMAGLAKGIRKSRGMVAKAMDSVAADMVLNLPTGNLNYTVTGNSTSGTADSAVANIRLTQPLTINGTTLATVVSEIQYAQGRAVLRNLGQV